MTQALILGSILGVFSGILPGPFSGLVAATALHQGFRAGLKLALIPLVTEGTVLAVTAVVISQVPRDALRWIGIGGGFLVLYLAWRTFKEGQEGAPDDLKEGETRKMGEGIALGLLSPDPWIFWLLVGSPLFLSAWHQGWAPGLAFFGAFVIILVGINIGWAALAAYGRRQLDPSWHRRLMMGAALALTIAGGVLIWQSWVGNFEEMVSGSEAVAESVEERVN